MTLSYQPRNLLITGGCGFIGSHFIRHALHVFPAANIINLDLLTYAGTLANIADCANNPRYQFVQGDIADLTLVKRLLEIHDIDTIVHFAAESHVDRSIATPQHFIQTNVLGTFSLLEAARGYWLEQKQWDQSQCRFHHISTDEVFGALTATDPAFTESTPYAPRSPYSASKAGSDHLVQAYYHTYGLPMTLSNCSNNYGPYQHPEKFIPTVINACLNGLPIPIYGDGSQIRDWLYVEDHCHGIAMILEQGSVGQSYNLGGQQEMNNLQLARQICTLMDQRLSSAKSCHELLQFVTDRPGHDWRYAIDNRKIQRELGWQPRENLLTGLAKTIDFYCREASSAFRSVFSSVSL